MKRWPFLTVVIVGMALSQLSAADWPQFRFDAGHTAASPDSLPTEMHLAWVKVFPAPQPAFPNEVRLRYDESYEPVVMGKTMFVPSMVADTVTALDTETGAERWRYVTDGPVRFAPVAWEDRVYFVSDDGFLYCVSAQEGSLIWKFRGLPDSRKDRKLLGDERLISLWPARGGPVLAEGVVYFAAGFWPAEHVFIHAVDATTGEQIWSNTESNHIPDANMDHGVSYYAGLTPQGYLAVVGDTLVVPCGAQLPAFLDLKTGALGKYTMGWGGRTGLPKGTWWVAGTGKYLVHGGDLYDISRANQEQFRDPRGRRNYKNMLYPGGFTRLQIDHTNQKYLTAFQEPVLTSDVLYTNNAGIVAYDLSQASLEERLIGEAPEHRSNDRYPDRMKGSFRQHWKLPFDLKLHIKAGQRLYASSESAVVGIDIPDQDGGVLQVAWWAEIDGTPHRMLAAAGKLFVVTREGQIFAFSGQQQAEVVVHPKPQPVFANTDDAWSKRVATVLHRTGIQDGYVLVAGVGTGRLVEELVRQSNCHVIGVDEDAQKIELLRDKFQSMGLYGTRVVGHVGDPLSYPLPPYFAHLVVSEERLGEVDSRSVEALYHVLRPYGGTACLEIAETQRDSFAQTVSAVGLFGSDVRWIGDTVLLSRQGAIPDSADWTHRDADAANSGASQERSLTAPLGVLWFDGSLRWNRQPGNAAVRVCGGRVFVHAERLHAVDVFTGRQLWQVSLPSTVRQGSDFVAADDGVFVTDRRTILVLEPVKGQISRRIVLPDDLPQPWSDIHVLDEYLVGTSGKHLVCINHQTGELVWKYECGRANLSFALGNGNVFCAELINKRRGETDKDGKTRAFDIASGELLWEVASSTPIRYSQPHDLLVAASGVYRGSDGSQVRPGGNSEAIVGDRLLVGDSDTFAMHDLLTGAPLGDELSWSRRGCTSLRASSSLLTTRFHGNAAFIDLESRDITSLWGVRSACSNNLFPANGVLNVPNLTGGCTCNYTPVSQAFVPTAVIERAPR